MDNKEAIRTIETALNHLEQANKALIDAEVYDDEELFEGEACVLSNARECLALLAQSSPAHPAIPEEVRKCLFDALDCLREWVKPLLTSDARKEFVEMDLPSRARDWLAKCPTANDKATCPVCKHEEVDTVYRCQWCGENFSPPREPKETP